MLFNEAIIVFLFLIFKDIVCSNPIFQYKSFRELRMSYKEPSYFYDSESAHILCANDRMVWKMLSIYVEYPI